VEIKKEKLLYDYLLSWSRGSVDGNSYRTLNNEMRCEDLKEISNELKKHYKTTDTFLFSNVVLLSKYSGDSNGD